MGQNIEYTVDKNGEVRVVKIADSKPYSVGITAAEEDFSPTRTFTGRASKWASFHEMLASLEPGKWFIVGPFEDKAELRRARGTANRLYERKDARGNKLPKLATSVVSDKPLYFAVMVLEEEDESPNGDS